jgi:uncharacterized protein (DUF433 family)
MTNALLTRREAAELSGTTETTVKKAVDLHVIPARRRGSQSLIESDDVPVLVMLGHLTGVGLARAHKRRLRSWLRDADAPAEIVLIPGLVVRRLDEVDAARERAARYVRLRDEWVVSDPQIKGGDPVIKGTRLSVHSLAARLAEGEPDDVLEQDLPHIPAEARDAAVLYARANPRRGRPRRAPRPA